MMVISMGKIREKFIFLLPTFTIVFQWIAIAGINLSWLISGVLLISILIKRNWILQKRIPFLVFLIFMISPFFTFLFGRANSFNSSLYISIATGVIYFLYISTLEHDMFEKFMFGGLFSCILFAIWGGYEIFTGNYILSDHEIFTQRPTWNGMYYPIAAFPNTNDIAQYLTILFPMASFILLKKNKLLWVISSVLVLFVIYASGSRLCMMCFLGVWGMSLLWKLVSDRRAKTLLTIIFITILIIVGLFVVDAKTGIVTTVLEQFFLVDTGADYYSAREEIYADVLRVAATLPFGGFGSAYTANEFPPHNFLLFVLCDYGWFAAIFLFVVLMKFGFRYFSVASQKRDDLFIVLLLSTLILFPVLSSVSSTNEQRKIIWIVLGIFMNQFLCCREVGRKDSGIIRNVNRSMS